MSTDPSTPRELVAAMRAAVDGLLAALETWHAALPDGDPWRRHREPHRIPRTRRRSDRQCRRHCDICRTRAIRARLAACGDDDAETAAAIGLHAADIVTDDTTAKACTERIRAVHATHRSTKPIRIPRWDW